MIYILALFLGGIAGFMIGKERNIIELEFERERCKRFIDEYNKLYRRMISEQRN